MFLLNLFGKSSNQNDQEKFDRISFKIDLNQNVPKMISSSQTDIAQEQQFNPNHPLYYQIFPKEEEKFVDYTTTENDTISGLAMKLNIGEKVIRSINGISGSIYPGMKIKLPEGTDIRHLDVSPEPKINRYKISQILGNTDKSQQLVNAKFNVYYSVGVSGNIKGSLSLNSNYLIFNPSLQNEENREKFAGSMERLLKFNAIVETVDIQDAFFMELPVMGDSEVPQTESVVQFLLYRVGNTKIEKKYSQRLKQLKLDHKAIASMNFVICPTQDKSAGEIGQEIVQKIKIIIKEIEEKEQEINLEDKHRLTNIPFFDIIHQNIQNKVEEETQAIELPSKIINPSAVLGSLSEPSEIVTPEEYGGIVNSMPVLYKLYNWVRVYSCTKDGSSFTTFLNRCLNVQPCVLLVKEHKGYKFGAFLSDSIVAGKSGRGQMFIFTFRDKETPDVYHWTGANESFVYVQKEMGIGIGMGFKYGIFLKNDLDRGSTAPTKTFGNEDILSKKEDFYIDEVEVWGIDMSY